MHSPAGRLSTPAPTMDFTRLNRRAAMVPSPPDTSPSPGSSSAADAADIYNLEGSDDMKLSLGAAEKEGLIAVGETIVLAGANATEDVSDSKATRAFILYERTIVTVDCCNKMK